MKTVVIGATGIIGNHIVRELLAQGHEVIAVSRGVTPAINLEGLDVKTVKADLSDVQSLKKALAGADWVFQAAAYYPKDAFHREEHQKNALAEIHNVIAASLYSGIKRLIYTSSLTTIGQAKTSELATEDLPYDQLGHDPHPYFLVKHLCEQELVKAAKKDGLPVVMVNPTGCFGPYELKPKNLCLIPQLINGEVPALVNHNMNIVDTADVARGHVLAAQKGRIAERYILGGHNTTIVEFVNEVCALAGVTPPRFTVPIKVGLCLCYSSEIIGLLTGKPPKMPALGLKFVQYGQHFSIHKAQKELGYLISPMRPCFERAIAWYKKIGYCS